MLGVRTAGPWKVLSGSRRVLGRFLAYLQRVFVAVGVGLEGFVGGRSRLGEVAM